MTEEGQVSLKDCEKSATKVCRIVAAENFFTVLIL